MTPLETLLEDMAERVRRADFPALALLAPQLEAALTGFGGSVDPAVMSRLRRKAEENAQLLEAARRGLRAARRTPQAGRNPARGGWLANLRWQRPPL